MAGGPYKLQKGTKVPIQDYVGSRMEDADGTRSPLPVSSGGSADIDVPDDAFRLRLKPDFAVRVSTDESPGFYEVASGETLELWVSDVSTITVTDPAANGGSVSFAIDHY